RGHPAVDRVSASLESDSAPTDVDTLSLHDALPISWRERESGKEIEQKVRVDSRGLDKVLGLLRGVGALSIGAAAAAPMLKAPTRSEEHTSELQSRENLVCRLLPENKNSSGRECDGG